MTSRDKILKNCKYYKSVTTKTYIKYTLLNIVDLLLKIVIRAGILLFITILVKHGFESIDIYNIAEVSEEGLFLISLGISFLISKIVYKPLEFAIDLLRKYIIDYIYKSDYENSDGKIRTITKCITEVINDTCNPDSTLDKIHDDILYIDSVINGLSRYIKHEEGLSNKLKLSIEKLFKFLWELDMIQAYYYIRQIDPKVDSSKMAYASIINKGIAPIVKEYCNLSNINANVSDTVDLMWYFHMKESRKDFKTSISVINAIHVLYNADIENLFSAKVKTHQKEIEEAMDYIFDFKNGKLLNSNVVTYKEVKEQLKPLEIYLDDLDKFSIETIDKTVKNERFINNQIREGRTQESLT